MNVVIDTNVLVSALLNADGVPAKILNLVFERKINIVCDSRLVSEYNNVLHRAKFGFATELINSILGFIVMESVFVKALPCELEFSDNDDKKFYEVFNTKQADFLITGNIKHFPIEKNIVNPKTFYDFYNTGNK